jgi:DNA-binding SARP family transcriptional activator/TolB-like protein
MQHVAGIQSLTARESATPPEGGARLSVSLVGRAAIAFNGRTVELRTQKANAVLGYLALTEAKQESRERLVGLFWSRSDEEKARASLRQVVRELRSAFEEVGYSGFAARRLSIHFDPARLDVDVENVIRFAEVGRVHSLLLNTPRLDERILEGMDDLDPSFRIWILAKRQTIHDRLMRSLDAGLFANNVETGVKNEIAKAIANLDPTHEEACCHLMRSHAQQGDVAGALRIYNELWGLLDHDYGMEPSAATEALVAEIKLGAFERPPGRGVGLQPGMPAATTGEAANRPGLAEFKNTAAPAKMRLVLRPFGMHGVDGDHVHLVQGFGLHLAACLVRFREWTVIDRPNPAAALRLTDSVPQYCIESTAYQAGAEINMVMVLRDETSGVYIWSESFRLSLDNWFEAQQRIIRRIASSLNVQLSAERLMRLAGEPDVSLDIYDRWLRGQSLMTRFDPDSWQRAVTIFRDTIRENPMFSPSYSSLVQMNNIEHIVHPGVLPDPDKAKVTLELAKTAVRLDPVDSRAHLCCGWSHVWAFREAEAAPHMELACELNDNDPWTLLSCAHYSAFCGSIEQARLRADQSLALSPAPSYLEWAYHVTIRFLCEDYAGALAACDRAHGATPLVPAWRAAALFRLGEPVMAREEAQRFLNGIRSFWVGSHAPTDEAVACWTLQAHPISVGSRREALRDALRGAGIPAEGVARLSRF